MESTHGILSRMQHQADRWEQSGDRRMLFLRCYFLMTQNMHRAIQEGQFRDGIWAERLLQRFAAYYFHALDLFDRDDPGTPAVWRQVHEAAANPRLHALQHVLLGINAHINYDLVLALYDEMHPELPALKREGFDLRQSDHNLVNQIIAETIDTVQDQVLEPHSGMLALVDALMGRADEWILSQMITGWRSEVWQEACAMLDTENPEQRERHRLQLEENVLKKAEAILAF